MNSSSSSADVLIGVIKLEANARAKRSERSERKSSTLLSPRRNDHFKRCLLMIRNMHAFLPDAMRDASSLLAWYGAQRASTLLQSSLPSVR